MRRRLTTMTWRPAETGAESMIELAPEELMHLLRDYPRLDKPEARPANKLGAALFPWATAVSAIVFGAIAAKVFPPTAVWAVVTTFVGVIVAHVYPWTVKLWAGLGRRRRDRRIQRLYAEPVLALLNAVQVLVTENHSLSVNSLFHPILASKLLETGVIPAAQVAARSLQTQLRNLTRRAPGMPVTSLLEELREFLQLWIQLVNTLGYPLREILKDAGKAAESEALLRSWREVSRKGESVFTEYQRLVGVIRVSDPETRLHDYLEDLVSLR